ncbi:MAG: biotin--[acetyl-CoA-carboxylase] ligase [Bacteroidota bacterium]
MDDKEIKQTLGTKIFGKIFHNFQTIDSTNIYAKALAQTGGQHGTLVITEEQTSGRGRMGRIWKSEKGKNLTFSIIVHPTIPSEKFGIISLMAGIAVTETIQSITGLSVLCKWPNDVLLNRKKVCGILCEGIFPLDKPPVVVIGIGINVNQREFPHELRESATSLLLESGKDFDRTEILGQVLSSLERWYDALETGETEKIISAWRAQNYLLGKEITIDHNGKHIKGVAGDISEDGGLLLQAEGQEIKVIAGDITIGR